MANKHSDDRSFNKAFRKLMKEQHEIEDFRTLPIDERLRLSRKSEEKLARAVRRSLRDVCCVKEPDKVSGEHLAAIIQLSCMDIIASDGMKALLRFREKAGGSANVLKLIEQRLAELFSMVDQTGQMSSEQYEQWIEDHLNDPDED